MTNDHHPTFTPAERAEGLRRAEESRAFWYGPIEPIEALLPTGVDPRRLRQMPLPMRKRYVAAVRGEAGPLGAIRAQCAECCGYDREAVTTCPATACPLWQYRPWQPEAPAA